MHQGKQGKYVAITDIQTEGSVNKPWLVDR